MPFFILQKVQMSSKILPQIPNFASLQCTILDHLLNFVKFRQKTIFSSLHQFFIKKRNPQIIPDRIEPFWLQDK